MAVLINEFEIELAPPPEGEGRQASAEQQGPAGPPRRPQALSPLDLRDVERFLAARAARVRAD